MKELYNEILKRTNNEEYAKIVIEKHLYTSWDSLKEYGKYLVDFYFNIPKDLKNYINYELFSDKHIDNNIYIINNHIYQTYDLCGDFV